MDSLGFVRLIHYFKVEQAKSYILTLRPIDRVKLTASAGINQSSAGKLSEHSDNGVDFTQSVDTYGLLLLKYDIRLKIYVTKRVALLFRAVITGQNNAGVAYSNNYTGGLIVKF